MIINKLMEEQGLSYTSEELQKSIKEFIKMGGYGDEFTVDDYSLQAGPVGMWIFTNMNFKYNLVMSALEERVVILPSGENISE